MADEAPTTQPAAEGADNSNPTPNNPASAGLPSIIAADDLELSGEAGAASGTLTPTLGGGGGAGTGTLTGTATPRSGVSDMALTAEQRSLSLRVSLADVTARASGQYAQRRYDEAAEGYAQAAEMQAEMNGEMAPENAEILFLYGRSLFKVGQGKSDVLGGRAPATGEGQKVQQQQQPEKKKTKKKNTSNKSANGEAAAAVAGSSKEGGDDVAEEAAKIIANEAGVAKAEKDGLEEKKPLFQFTGDENWDDSDEEEGADDAEADEEEDEVEDDLGTAFEILDLARLLFLKQLEEKLSAEDSSEDKGKEVANGEGDDVGTRHIKERLADTHDLLAEISLENERYVVGQPAGNFSRAVLADRFATGILTRSLMPESP